MPVPSVFISSVQTGFEDYRSAARDGVLRSGMHPVMAEDQPAESSSPRRALLDEVRDADVYLLLLGPRYGAAEASAVSPTEDEYQEAVRTNRSIIVLVGEMEMEPAQREFLKRVRGTWGDGVLYGRFTTPNELMLGVVAALSNWKVGLVENIAQSSQRATELAEGDPRSMTGHSGAMARVALYPTIETTLLGPVQLEDETLSDALATAAREARLVPQRIGLKSDTTSVGVKLVGTELDNFTPIEIDVRANGAVVTQGSVQDADRHNLFSGSLVNPARFAGLIGASGQFSRTVLDRVDAEGQVGRLAVVACVPNVQYKAWGEVKGNSMRMSTSLARAVAPQPALIYPRGELGSQKFIREITAAMRRVFADANALP